MMGDELYILSEMKKAEQKMITENSMHRNMVAELETT